MNFAAGPWIMAPKAYYDVVLRGLTYELNLLYRINVAAFSADLILAGTVGTHVWHRSIADADPRVANHGDYWQLGVTAGCTWAF